MISQSIDTDVHYLTLKCKHCYYFQKNNGNQLENTNLNKSTNIIYLILILVFLERNHDKVPG